MLNRVRQFGGSEPNPGQDCDRPRRLVAECNERRHKVIYAAHSAPSSAYDRRGHRSRCTRAHGTAPSSTITRSSCCSALARAFLARAFPGRRLFTGRLFLRGCSPLSATVLFVDRCPSAPFRCFFGDAFRLVALLDVPGFTTLIARIAGLVATGHVDLRRECRSPFCATRHSVARRNPLHVAQASVSNGRRLAAHVQKGIVQPFLERRMLARNNAYKGAV